MTKRYETILFDLDGTLTDSKAGIYQSIRYALAKMGRSVPPDTQLRRFLGPPLAHSFQNVMGLSPELAAEAVSYYREYFTDRGIFENQPYPGVPAMLEALCRSGKTVILATAKPLVFAKRILDHFALSSYFAAQYGCELDGTRADKAEVIRYALAQSRIDPKSAVMVGDRCYDIDGAHAAGLDAIAVLYGYGTREELAHADGFATSVEALLPQLTNA